MCPVIFSPLGFTEHKFLPFLKIMHRYLMRMRMVSYEAACHMHTQMVNFHNKALGDGLVNSKDCWLIILLDEGELSMIILIGYHYLVLKEYMWHSRLSHCFSTGCICCFCLVPQMRFCILLWYSSAITWSLVKKKLSVTWIPFNLLEYNAKLVGSRNLPKRQQNCNFKLYFPCSYLLEF